MKFRAVIADSGYMRELLNIVTMFARMSKNLVINVQPSKIIIQIEGEVEAGQCLWCEIDASDRDGFFTEYVMDGIDQAHNQIYLIAVASDLPRALSSVKNSVIDFVKLKLIKSDVPCLAVELNGTSPTYNNDEIKIQKIQNVIPVTVVPRSEWQDFALPLNIYYDLEVPLPDIKMLKGMLDRKTNLSPSVTVLGNLDGKLSLLVESPLFTVASHYNGRRSVRSDKAITEDTPEASCKVDSKKLYTLCDSVASLFSVGITANIKNQHLLNVRFDTNEQVSVNFILPAVDYE